MSLMSETDTLPAERKVVYWFHVSRGKEHAEAMVLAAEFDMGAPVKRFTTQEETA